MTGDPVDHLVGELETWAKKNATVGNIEDTELVLELLLDHVVDDPSELEPGDLDELLLEIYPNLVTVLAPAELGDVVPSTRDLVAFFAATGRIRPELVDPLRRELDDVEPRFVDAVMDPDNWGPTRTVTQTMVADGVDLTDEVAVMRWMTEHHPETPLDDEDEPESLAEALGLPERLPALRLPPEADLAAAAQRSGLFHRASELARWVGDGRTVPVDEEAAAALGIALPDLARVWDLAMAVGLLDVESDTVTGYPDDGWPESDDDALDSWALGFDITVSSLDADGDLDFEGAGAVCLALFLDRTAGVPRAELSELLHADAIDGLDPEDADPAWTAWVEAHGDPATVLLDRLADHGAVQSDGDLVHLTPLGLWRLWEQLTEGGIEIPLLPPTDEMTAVDLLAAADGLSEEALDEEIQAWLASRGTQAAAELLDAAAEGDPADRLFAVAVVKGLGERAEPQWRDALAKPELQAYAKVALAGELTRDDIAWLITDMLAVTEPDDDLGAEVAAAVPPGREHEIIDMMWRTGHPQAVEVLTMLGEHHPDRKLAKAARTAAFKAASRQNQE